MAVCANAGIAVDIASVSAKMGYMNFIWLLSDLLGTQRSVYRWVPREPSNSGMARHGSR
jgi:hypothetical protein